MDARSRSTSTRDREQWRELERRASAGWSTSCSSSLMVAEERITTKFSGLVGAHGTEEEATFLATQQVDEARHMQFYARFQDEVVADAGGDRRARRARPRAGLRRLPPDLRRGARRGPRAARRRARRPRGEGPLRHDLPPDPRGHARPDDVQVRHRLPRARGAAARASSRATRRSTTTRRATSATASGSCARRSREHPEQADVVRADAARPAARRSPSRSTPPGDGDGADRSLGVDRGRPPRRSRSTA